MSTVRSEAERIADVRRILVAAKGLALDHDELARSSGLSREGVALALARNLETDATDDELRSLVARAGDAPFVAVILSANVFVAALRAIALARATSARVVVRPSRRDPAFARALLAGVADPAIRLDEQLDVAAVSEGEIHVYGRDETIADVRKRARVRVRGHGSGMGVAIVTGASEAAPLAEDVVAFDQRGCLSPRIALFVGSDPMPFAEELHEALARAIPRGVASPEERAEIQRYADTMAFAGHVRAGREHVVGIAPQGTPLVLPPPHRTLHVATVRSYEEAAARLAPFAKGIVTVGAQDLDVARAIAPSWARLSVLGRMQRPPLDGPVDLREA